MDLPKNRRKSSNTVLEKTSARRNLGYRGPKKSLVLRSSKAVYINAWPNRRRWKERDYAEAATRSRTPQCRGGVQDPQTGSKPPCSRRLDCQSPHHLFELARVAHRQDL